VQYLQWLRWYGIIVVDGFLPEHAGWRYARIFKSEAFGHLGENFCPRCRSDSPSQISVIYVIGLTFACCLTYLTIGSERLLNATVHWRSTTCSTGGIFETMTRPLGISAGNAEYAAFDLIVLAAVTVRELCAIVERHPLALHP